MKELEKYITDERTGLKYELAGDCYFLAGDNEPEEHCPIGIWWCGCPVDTSAEGRSTDRAGRRDQRHLRYLRECKKTTYTALVIEGKLPDYLANVNEQAEEMLFQLVKQMAKDEGVDEALKRRNQFGWVQRMNSIRNRAEEIVIKELINN